MSEVLHQRSVRHGKSSGLDQKISKSKHKSKALALKAGHKKKHIDSSCSVSAATYTTAYSDEGSVHSVACENPRKEGRFSNIRRRMSLNAMSAAEPIQSERMADGTCKANYGEQNYDNDVDYGYDECHKKNETRLGAFRRRMSLNVKQPTEVVKQSDSLLQDQTESSHESPNEDEIDMGYGYGSPEKESVAQTRLGAFRKRMSLNLMPSSHSLPDNDVDQKSNNTEHESEHRTESRMGAIRRRMSLNLMPNVQAKCNDTMLYDSMQESCDSMEFDELDMGYENTSPKKTESRIGAFRRRMSLNIMPSAPVKQNDNDDSSQTGGNNSKNTEEIDMGYEHPKKNESRIGAIRRRMSLNLMPTNPVKHDSHLLDDDDSQSSQGSHEEDEYERNHETKPESRIGAFRRRMSLNIMPAAPVKHNDSLLDHEEDSPNNSDNEQVHKEPENPKRTESRIGAFRRRMSLNIMPNSEAKQCDYVLDDASVNSEVDIDMEYGYGDTTSMDQKPELPPSSHVEMKFESQESISTKPESRMGAIRRRMSLNPIPTAPVKHDNSLLDRDKQDSSDNSESEEVDMGYGENPPKAESRIGAFRRRMSLNIMPSSQAKPCDNMLDDASVNSEVEEIDYGYGDTMNEKPEQQSSCQDEDERRQENVSTKPESRMGAFKRRMSFNLMPTAPVQNNDSLLVKDKQDNSDNSESEEVDMGYEQPPKAESRIGAFRRRMSLNVMPTSQAKPCDNMLDDASVNSEAEIDMEYGYVNTNYTNKKLDSQSRRKKKDSKVVGQREEDAETSSVNSDVQSQSGESRLGAFRRRVSLNLMPTQETKPVNSLLDKSSEASNCDNQNDDVDYGYGCDDSPKKTTVEEPESRVSVFRRRMSLNIMPAQDTCQKESDADLSPGSTCSRIGAFRRRMSIKASGIFATTTSSQKAPALGDYTGTTDLEDADEDEGLAPQDNTEPTKSADKIRKEKHSGRKVRKDVSFDEKGAVNSSRDELENKKGEKHSRSSRHGKSSDKSTEKKDTHSSHRDRKHSRSDNRKKEEETTEKRDHRRRRDSRRSTKDDTEKDRTSERRRNSHRKDHHECDEKKDATVQGNENENVGIEHEESNEKKERRRIQNKSRSMKRAKSSERDPHSSEKDHQKSERERHSREKDHHSREKEHHSSSGKHHRSREKDHHSRERDHHSRERDHHSRERDHHSRERHHHSSERHHHKSREKSKDAEHRHHRSDRGRSKTGEAIEHEKRRSRHEKCEKEKSSSRRHQSEMSRENNKNQISSQSNEKDENRSSRQREKSDKSRHNKDADNDRNLSRRTSKRQDQSTKSSERKEGTGKIVKDSDSSLDKVKRPVESNTIVAKEEDLPENNSSDESEEKDLSHENRHGRTGKKHKKPTQKLLSDGVGFEEFDNNSFAGIDIKKHPIPSDNVLSEGFNPLSSPEDDVDEDSDDDDNIIICVPLGLQEKGVREQASQYFFSADLDGEELTENDTCCGDDFSCNSEFDTDAEKSKLPDESFEDFIKIDRVPSPKDSMDPLEDRRAATKGDDRKPNKDKEESNMISEENPRSPFKVNQKVPLSEKLGMIDTEKRSTRKQAKTKSEHNKSKKPGMVRRTASADSISLKYTATQAQKELLSESSPPSPDRSLADRSCASRMSTATKQRRLGRIKGRKLVRHNSTDSVSSCNYDDSDTSSLNGSIRRSRSLYQPSQEDRLLAPMYDE